MTDHHLVSQFEAYSTWRNDLAKAIFDYRTWLNDEDLNDAQADLRLQHLIDRLGEDKLAVAFVAEFSRGKTELINAIFFAEYKQRLLPSTAGRTTMCPTELLYDASRPPSIMLLPIETRSTDIATSEYKRYADEWTILPLDLASPENLNEAFLQVSQTKRISIEEAKRYGLYREDDPDNALNVYDDQTVDVPRWRHAVVNFPHRLLEQGLVILDTPGLNSIGTEPELTLNLLPNAHAVLFILSADTGVTKSDIQVWRDHIGNQYGRRKGLLVVMNKIDGLWDELKSADEIEAEICRQLHSCADLLGVADRQVYPVSAQKGLLAKIHGDGALLARSRLPQLEAALSDEVIPSKQEIVRDNTESEIRDILLATGTVLQGRLANLDEQIQELGSLRGKNEDVVSHMMAKVQADKERFERGLQRFQALRSVFSQETNKLFSHLGMDTLKAAVKETRIAMLNSRFTKGLRNAMSGFFTKVKDNIADSSMQVEEIKGLMEAMYKKFSDELGLNSITPAHFSMYKFLKELERLETTYETHFNTFLNMLTQEQYTLTSKFFDTLASRVIQVYELANREVETWLKAVMAPMETQVREHQLQLRRRMESVKRIHKATNTLEDRIGELESARDTAWKQLAEFSRIRGGIETALEGRAAAPAEARAA